MFGVEVHEGEMDGSPTTKVIHSREIFLLPDPYLLEKFVLDFLRLDGVLYLRIL